MITAILVPTMPGHSFRRDWHSGHVRTPSTRLKKWEFLSYFHMKFWIIWLSLACSVVSIFFVYINVCCFCCFQYFGTVSTAYMYFPTINLDKASDKIKVKETETSKFWSHFKSFIGPHPAIDEHERDPSQPWHQPVGVSGDDARYTLAGRKIIIMMISSVLQQIESVLSFYVSWG